MCTGYSNVFATAPQSGIGVLPIKIIVLFDT